MRGRQQNHRALGAFLYRRPRTSRRLHSSALRGCSAYRPPPGHGRERRGGRPMEHVESLCGCVGAVPAAQRPALSGLAYAFLARGGTNAGRRVPVRLPEVRSGETELPPGVWPSRQQLGLALASTPVGSSPTRWIAESRRSPARRAGWDDGRRSLREPSWRVPPWTAFCRRCGGETPRKPLNSAFSAELPRRSLRDAA